MSGSAPAQSATGEAPTAAEITREIALRIYIGLAGQTYSYTDSDSAERKRPAPKQLALMSFKLAEAFQQADAEVNATALAIERARNTFKAEDLDLASLHQPKS